MFENNNYSNENVNEQNNSQTVQSGSDAAHTEHNNGQTAGGAAGNADSTGNTGSYTGSGYTGGYSGSGYTGGYSGMNAGGYQNGGQGGYQNNAGYRSGGRISGQPLSECGTERNRTKRRRTGRHGAERTASRQLQRLWQLSVPAGKLPVRQYFFQ